MNSEEVLQQWAERSGEYSPDYYAYYGPNETSELLRARLEDLVGTDAAVLELGCSSGRHLAHLREHGFEELHGIDVNDEAFDVMADAYPDLFGDGTFYADAIENVIREFPDDRFDAVYSVETLQHVHPDNDWVFDAIARITDDVLVTVESEEAGKNDVSGKDEKDGESGKDEKNRESGKDEEGDSGGEEGDHSNERDVNYVNDELPLYYRDWQQVFTTRGFAEVETESLDRDTFRAFRLTGDSPTDRRTPN